MILETDRLKLRPFQSDDIEAIERPTPPQHKAGGCVKRLTRLSEIGKLLVAPFPTAAREGGAMEGAMAIINFWSGRLLRVELDDRHPKGGLK